MMGGIGGMGSGVGMAFMGLFWLGLIAIAVWAASRLTGRSPGPGASAPESARQILDRRFAAGAIDDQEYARSRRVLDGGGVQDVPR